MGFRRIGTLVVAVVLLTGGLVTAAATDLVDQSEDRSAAQVLDRYADEEAAAVSDQTVRYTETLRDLAASVGAQSDLRGDDFSRITAGLNAGRLPGAASVGFAVPVTTTQIPAVQRTWRAHGATGLTLRPAPGTAQHTFVIFEHTFDNATTVPGLDLAASPQAGQALRNAEQNGAPAISPAFSLLRDQHLAAADRQTSILFAVPVYTGLGSAAPDVFIGWIVMPVRGQDFLAPTLLDRGHDAVQVTVTDGLNTGSTDTGSTDTGSTDTGSTGSGRNSAAGQLPTLAAIAPGRRDTEGPLARHRSLVAGTRHWQLTIWPTTGLDDSSAHDMSLFTLTSGLALTLLLGTLTGVLAGSRHRALHRVEQATAALRRDIERREHVEAQLREREQELQRLAFHDGLTGLANRTLFYDRLTHALATHARAQRLVAVLFIDLDGFKQVNDQLGHAAGDAVLRTLAARMRTSLRTVDTVARFGGDEFAILLEGLTTPADARIAAERVITDAQHPIDIDGTPARVSASIGIAISRPDTIADDLIREADAAMYTAKNSGKNRYVEAGTPG